MPDLAAAFQAAWANIDSGQIQAVTNVTIGDRAITVEYRQTWNRDDNAQSTTRTADGSITTWQTASVDGERYRQVGDGPWLVDTEPAADDAGAELMTEVDRLAGTVRVAGTDVRDGRELLRLEPTVPAPLTAALFGLTEPSVTAFEATVSFLATPDGTPAFIDVTASWQQSPNGRHEGGTWQTEMKLSRLNSRLVVPKPEDVWLRFTSKADRYSLAHPDGWLESEEGGDQVFIVAGSSDQFDMSMSGSRLVVRTIPLPAGATLAEVVTWTREARESELGGDATAEAIEIAGSTGYLVRVSGIAGGMYFVTNDVVVVSGGTIYDLVWISDPAFESLELPMFRQLITTFTIA